MTTHDHSAGTVLRRAGWALAAAVLLGGAVFEAAKHGGSTIALAALGVVGPGQSLVPGATQRRVRGEPVRWAVYHLVHRPWLPLAVMIGSAFAGQPAAAGLFALGCAWLGHLAVERACGRLVAAPAGAATGGPACAGLPTCGATPSPSPSSGRWEPSPIPIGSRTHVPASCSAPSPGPHESGTACSEWPEPTARSAGPVPPESPGRTAPLLRR